MNDRMKTWLATAGSAGSQKLASSFGSIVSNANQAVHKAASDRDSTHLRLPIDSARRLRWFEQHDVNSVVRQHAEEKQQLMACVAAMRRSMLQHGVQVRRSMVGS